jgi:hypothetical protein
MLDKRSINNVVRQTSLLRNRVVLASLVRGHMIRDKTLVT